MRRCYKYIRSLLMARHARTNCVLLFTQSQTLPRFGTAGKQQSGRETRRDATGLASLAVPLSLTLKSFLS